MLSYDSCSHKSECRKFLLKTRMEQKKTYFCENLCKLNEKNNFSTYLSLVGGVLNYLVGQGQVSFHKLRCGGGICHLWFHMVLSLLKVPEVTSIEAPVCR